MADYLSIYEAALKSYVLWLPILIAALYEWYIGR